jgi:hypothetical protein
LHKLHQLALPAVDAPVLPAPRRRALSESPEQQGRRRGSDYWARSSRLLLALVSRLLRSLCR